MAVFIIFYYWIGIIFWGALGRSFFCRFFFFLGLGWFLDQIVVVNVVVVSVDIFLFFIN